MGKGTSRAVHVDVHWSVHWSVHWAVNGAVDWAVNEDSPHPGLLDFLLDAKVEA
jgi:hypothetical protein